MTAEVVAPLTEEQYDLLSFLEQFYLTNSSLPTREFCKTIGLDETLFTSSMKLQVFREALEERGLPVGLLIVSVDKDGKETKEDIKNWRDFALTEEQLTAANTMMDVNDNRSKRKKLAELGISTNKYASWMRDPVFTGYLRSRAESLLGDSQPDAHLALVDRVRSGDITAIKYFNELTGRYVPIQNSLSNNGFDSKMILIRVVEIMQRHLADQPQLLANIANDLIALADGPTPLAGPNNTPVEVVHQPKPMPSISRVSTLPRNESISGSI